MGEPVEPPSATWQHTVAMLPVSIAEVTDERLVIHPYPLFGPMIPFNKDAPFLSKTSASLLNNPMYSLKPTRSVFPILDHQFVMKRNIATNLSEMIDLS